jgi:hypothetical protein
MNRKKAIGFVSLSGKLGFLSLALGPWMSGTSLATEVDSDCHALKLKAASGVSQDAIHTYEFNGTCNINALPETGPIVLQTVLANASGRWDGGKQEFTESFHLLGPVHLEGWVENGSAYKVDITPGEVSSTFKCADDPLLFANVVCMTTFHENLSGFAPFSNPAKKQNRPLLKGKTTLAEATAMSKQASAAAGASPPKPLPDVAPQAGATTSSSDTPTMPVVLSPSVGTTSPASGGPSGTQNTGTPTTATRAAAESTAAATGAAQTNVPATVPTVSPPTRSSPPTPGAQVARSPTTAQTPATGTMRSTAVAMLLNVEGEDLVKAQKVQVNGGQVSVQPMSGFGVGWSGDGQLYWSGGSKGAVMDLKVDIPVAAAYALELYLTRAPDYAQVKIQVDGQDAPVTRDGNSLDSYSPRVMQPTPRQIGKFSLAQGEHTISLMIVGKNSLSTDFLVGIDRIRLYPSGPAVTALQDVQKIPAPSATAEEPANAGHVAVQPVLPGPVELPCSRSLRDASCGIGGMCKKYETDVTNTTPGTLARGSKITLSNLGCRWVLDDGAQGIDCSHNKERGEETIAVILDSDLPSGATRIVHSILYDSPIEPAKETWRCIALVEPAERPTGRRP